jgi:hypothetical protein
VVFRETIDGIRILGCNPALIYERIGPSPAVAAVVQPPIDTVHHVLDEIRRP